VIPSRREARGKVLRRAKRERLELEPRRPRHALGCPELRRGDRGIPQDSDPLESRHCLGQELDQLSAQLRKIEESSIVRIDRPDGPGIDLRTVEYLVTFGGAKDDVGAVIVAKAKGFDALTALLRKLPISPADIETAIRILRSQPSHAIHDVILAQAAGQVRWAPGVMTTAGDEKPGILP
jgi:hypothetical protein